ncbi:MAG: helix-turn-helix domain-containing protein [Nitrospiraceae bacterium]
MEPPLLRVKEAAQLLSVSKWTIYRWIEEGRLEASKIGGGSLRIFRVSVMALVDENPDETGGKSRAPRSRPPWFASSRARAKKRL